MKIRQNHTELVGNRIARDLLSSGLAKFTEGIDPIVAIIKEILNQDIKQEAQIDAEAFEILDDNEEAIEFQRADRKQLFWMIKRKICEEDGFIIDKEDRYNNIAHNILSEIYDQDLIFFTVSETRIKSQIVRSIFDFGKSQDDIEDKVREKIGLLKKQIRRGTEEYEILYEKFFAEEMQKVGL